MPAFNFMKRFADDVRYGLKRQTVRADRKDGRAHARVGDTVKLYTGMRTKSCELLAVATVISVAKVRILPTCMSINGRVLPSSIHSRDCEQTDNEFAQADGFEGFMDMAEWFEKTHGLPFDGTLIEWGEPR